MSDFQQPARQKTILEDRKLTMYSRNAAGGRASLKWAVINGNPRITVWTGVEGDKDGGKAEAKMDLKVFMGFISMLEDVIAAPAGEVAGGYIEMGFPRDGKVTITSDLHVGRDKEGVIFISVVARNGNAAVQFPFVSEDYHKFFHRGGESYSKAETSVALAKGYVKLLTNLVPLICKETWKEPDNNGKQGGKGGGGYGGNRGGGGGNYGGNRGGNYGGGNGGGQGNRYGGGQGGGGNSSGSDQNVDDLPWG